jgi:hypothetical protein
MARRPHARLITAGFDLHDVSHRTEYRCPKTSTHLSQRVPPIGSRTRQTILSSKRLWQKGKQEYVLRPRVEQELGQPIKLTMVSGKGKYRWQWRVASIMCLGRCGSPKEAQIAALEKVLQWLGSRRGYAMFQRLAGMAGYEFV